MSTFKKKNADILVHLGIWSFQVWFQFFEDFIFLFTIF